jgi:hypothetical protein
MHKDFADWYRVVALEPRQIPLELRWAGIEAFTAELQTNSAFDIVRLLFGKTPKDANVLVRFQTSFKKSDEAFPMRGNELEIEVLACGTVAHLLDSADTRLADAVALAVVCSDFQGLRQKPRLSDFLMLAEAYLHKRSDTLRAQIGPAIIKSPDPAISALVGKVETLEPSNWATSAPILSSVLVELSKSANIVAESFRDALTRLFEQLRLQQEESNMLWWLFSGYSRDRDVKMSELGLGTASIVAGKELADLTLTLPGPVAAEAFLDKMIQSVSDELKQEETSVSEAIGKKALADWTVKEFGSTDLSAVDDLCPVMFTLKHAANSTSDSEWVPLFERLSGVKADLVLMPTVLATQVYRECLLLKAIN